MAEERKYIDCARIIERDHKFVMSQLRRGKWIDVASLSMEDIEWLLLYVKVDKLRERLEKRLEILRARFRAEIVTDPEITEMIVRLSTPEQRQRLKFTCREMSVAVTKYQVTENPARNLRVTELEHLIDSCMWKSILRAGLPHKTGNLHTKVSEAASLHARCGHMDSAQDALMVGRLLRS